MPTPDSPGRGATWPCRGRGILADSQRFGGAGSNGQSRSGDVLQALLPLCIEQGAHSASVFVPCRTYLANLAAPAR